MGHARRRRRRDGIPRAGARASLAAAGHDVAVLTRRARGRDDIAWVPDGATGPWAAPLAGVDAIVNLAGEGIADRRWTAARKRRWSRAALLATSSLVEAALGLPRPPRVFVSGSGVGIYGPRGDETLTEAIAGRRRLRGHDGQRVGSRPRRRWRRGSPAGHAADRHGARPGGGALERMRLPFKLGVGGRLGSGQQWMSWIHLDDWVALVAAADRRTTRRPAPFNLDAPAPVRNVEFTKALGRVLHRPTVLPGAGGGAEAGAGRAVGRAAHRSAGGAGQGRRHRLPVPLPAHRRRPRRLGVGWVFSPAGGCTPRTPAVSGRSTSASWSESSCWF